MKEDESAGPKTDSRTLLAKFNVQIAPLFDLLKETENIEFTPTMTDPEPTFVPFLHADDDGDAFGPGAPGGARSPGGTTNRSDGWSVNKKGGFDASVEVRKNTFIFRKNYWRFFFRKFIRDCFFFAYISCMIFANFIFPRILFSKIEIFSRILFFHKSVFFSRI